jgi:hypothetical protein
MIRSNETSLQSANLTPRFGLIDGTTIREPTTGRESDYRPWEAPPITTRHENPDIEAHQAEVENMLSALIELVDVPDVTKELIGQHILSSDVRRDIENQNGYRNRLMLLPDLELDDTQLQLHQRVLLGTATIAENLTHMELVKRSSSEVAMVRTVGKSRTEYRTQMFEELGTAMGADFAMSEPRNFQIEGFDNNFFRDKLMESFIFSFKQDCGTLPGDIDVKARTSLIVCTNFKSGFDQDIRHVIQSSAQHDRAHIPMLRRVKPILEDLAGQNVTHPYVVGSITSVYAYNPEVAALLVERDLKRKKNLASYSIQSDGMYYNGL